MHKTLHVSKHEPDHRPTTNSTRSTLTTHTMAAAAADTRTAPADAAQGRKRAREAEHASGDTEDSAAAATTPTATQDPPVAAAAAAMPASTPTDHVAKRTQPANPFLKKDSGTAASWDDFEDGDQVLAGSKPTTKSLTTTPIALVDTIKDPIAVEKSSTPRPASAFGAFGTHPFAAPGITQSKLGTSFSGSGSWKRAAADSAAETASASLSAAESASTGQTTSTGTAQGTAGSTVSAPIKAFASVFGSGYKTSTIGFGSTTAAPTTTQLPSLITGLGTTAKTVSDGSAPTTGIVGSLSSSSADGKVNAEDSAKTPKQPPEWMRRKSSFDTFGKKRARSPSVENNDVDRVGKTTLFGTLAKPAENAISESVADDDADGDDKGDTTVDGSAASDTEVNGHTVSDAAQRSRQQSANAEDEDTDTPDNHARSTLEPAAVTTGEEDDKTVFTSRCKLFVWDTDVEKADKWRERGKGTIKVNVIGAGKSRDTTLTHEDIKRKSRILMRTDKSLRLVLNSPIFAHTKPHKVSDKFVEFLGVAPEEPTKVRKFLAQLPGQRVSEEFEDVVSELSAAAAATASSTTSSSVPKAVDSSSEAKPIDAK